MYRGHFLAPPYARRPLCTPNYSRLRHRAKGGGPCKWKNLTTVGLVGLVEAMGAVEAMEAMEAMEALTTVCLVVAQ